MLKKEERLEYQHAYYKKTRQDRLEYSKKYAKEHPEVAKRSDAKRFAKEQEIMIKLKSNGCSICGYDACMRALEFYHVNSEDKEFQVIARCLRRKDIFVIDELNKCVLLCANCHREITAKENGDYHA